MSVMTKIIMLKDTLPNEKGIKEGCWTRHQTGLSLRKSTRGVVCRERFDRRDFGRCGGMRWPSEPKSGNDENETER